MNPASANLLVAIAERVAFVKIAGRANFTLSVPFKSLLLGLRERGFRDFVLDLTECGTMDSTFLGVLAGLALSSTENKPAPDPFCLQLLNPNQRVSDLLENLGVAHLFTMIRGGNPMESALAPSPPPDATPTREEISRTCLEAHQLLMKVNPENIPKFKDVTRFLAEDLKKLNSKETQ